MSPLTGVPTNRTAVTTGADVGVALASSLACPGPTEFCARTWNLYSVPFDSDGTTWLVVLASLPEMSVQRENGSVAIAWRNW